jgi:hypothetical protein
VSEIHTIKKKIQMEGEEKVPKTSLVRVVLALFVCLFVCFVRDIPTKHANTHTYTCISPSVYTGVPICSVCISRRRFPPRCLVEYSPRGMSHVPGIWYEAAPNKVQPLAPGLPVTSLIVPMRGAHARLSSRRPLLPCMAGELQYGEEVGGGGLAGSHQITWRGL